MFDGGGEGFAGVCGFGCCKADEFGAGEGEGSGDKDGTKTFEAIVEGAWVTPVLAANEGGAGSSAADVEDDAENDKPNDCNDFDDGEDELCFTVTLDAE